MFGDDDVTATKAQVAPVVQRPVMDAWSVAEITGYIGELRAEIDRAEAAIGRKESHRKTVEGLFKTS